MHVKVITALSEIMKSLKLFFDTECFRIFFYFWLLTIFASYAKCLAESTYKLLKGLIPLFC